MLVCQSHNPLPSDGTSSGRVKPLCHRLQVSDPSMLAFVDVDVIDIMLHLNGESPRWQQVPEPSYQLFRGDEPGMDMKGERFITLNHGIRC